MIADPCPHRDELERLIEERLGPVREAEIEAHVEACPHCQNQLESLTVRRAWERDDRATDEARPSDGHAPDAAAVEGTAGGTELDPEISVSASNTMTVDRPRDGATTDYSTGERSGSTDTEPAEARAAVRTATFAHGEGAPDVSPISARAREHPEWPTIPGYELRQKLGEGGMGVVFLARQIGLNRPVAIKMIRGGNQARPEHFARFRIEAEAVARLRHPHVIQIYDIGEAEGLPYVSLELLEGGGLDDRLGGTPRPGREAAELIITLAEALQVAHDAGIVHRDIKPSNVLFARDGTPKVTDFGLAKRLESDSKQTESGAIMGSPSYMAPEQARGHAKDVGPAADVYALGAILYEMLTGRPPFKGETPIETIRQVVDTEAVPPSRLVPKIARDLETICLKCLNKEPSKRYESARALADDLARHCGGQTIHARRASVLERGAKWALRRPAAAALWAIGVIALLGLFIGGGLHFHNQNQHKLTLARKALELVRDGNRLRDAVRGPTSRDQLSQLRGDISNFLGRLENEDRTLIPDLPSQMEASLAQADAKIRDLNERQAQQARDDAERRRFTTFRERWTQAQFERGRVRAEPGRRS